MSNGPASGSCGPTEARSYVRTTLFALNVDSMMMMCKYAIPAMVKSGDGGAIVNIGSLRAIRPQKSTVYSVTKGAVMALTATIASDHGAQGIRANCIILGPVFTPGARGHPISGAGPAASGVRVYP